MPLHGICHPSCASPPPPLPSFPSLHFLLLPSLPSPPSLAHFAMQPHKALRPGFSDE